MAHTAQIIASCSFYLGWVFVACVSHVTQDQFSSKFFGLGKEISFSFAIRCNTDCCRLSVEKAIGAMDFDRSRRNLGEAPRELVFERIIYGERSSVLDDDVFKSPQVF